MHEDLRLPYLVTYNAAMRLHRAIFAMCFALAGCLGAVAQQFVLHRGKATVVVEGYGPRILRVTISLDEARALAGPGYGIVGKRGDSGWTKTDADHFRSGELSVDVSPDSPGSRLRERWPTSHGSSRVTRPTWASPSIVRMAPR